MKLMRYLLTPLKILMYLLILFLFIYFRNVIFLPNINHYVDTAQSYIENQFDISIPVYVSENIENSAVNNNADVSSIDTEKCKESSTIKSISTSGADLDTASIESSNLTVDKSPVKESLSSDNDVNEKTKKVEIDLLKQLTDAVNLLDSKVDKLYESGKAKVDAVLATSDNKQAVQTVGVPKPSEEKTIPSNESSNISVKTMDDRANVDLTEETKHLFYNARQSYWMGNSLGAENIYLKLATIENDNPDIYGELGNVYYSQGKWSDAGKAYYEAAIRLLSLDKNNQVNYLLRVIQGLDSDSAEKLKKKMSS